MSSVSQASTSRSPLVVGNWKLHHALQPSLELAKALDAGLRKRPLACEVAIAPTFTALHAVGRALPSASPIALAAQDLWHCDQGAFTGEVSAPLLRDVGCSWVIVGHSERRQLQHETDALVLAKVKAALRHRLKPIVCVGESLEQRRAERTLPVVLDQMHRVCATLHADEIARLVFAYEPIWAIGTGLAATPADAQQVHAAMRASLTAMSDANLAASLRLLYGGSVKADNAASLMAQPDVDGFLVGGASLVNESFLAIVAAASS